jgi:ADP-ribose pyrophosphatase YjhB (NUDIX family)
MGGRSPSFSKRIPEGDNRSRLVCDVCDFVQYVNPKIVVGAVCTWGERILLCRRAIEPRRGHWTIPAGFLEEGETAEDGARREAWEEARAGLELEGLLGLYSVPRISQVQIIFRAKLRSAEVAPGEESLEVRLFDWDEIPWDDLAFPSVRWALSHYQETRGQVVFAARGNPLAETGDDPRRRP